VPGAIATVETGKLAKIEAMGKQDALTKQSGVSIVKVSEFLPPPDRKIIIIDGDADGDKMAAAWTSLKAAVVRAGGKDTPVAGMLVKTKVGHWLLAYARDSNPSDSPKPTSCN